MKLVKLTVLSLMLLSLSPVASAALTAKEDVDGVMCPRLEAQVKDALESNAARNADKAEANESVKGG